VEFGGDIAADDVLDTYPCGLYFANLRTLSGGAVKRRCAAEWLPGSREEAGAGDRESTHLNKLRHFASLLFRFRCVLLLHHAQPRYRQLELHFELVLSFISLVVPPPLALQTYDK
jgi:hypothetical protein